MTTGKVKRAGNRSTKVQRFPLDLGTSSAQRATLTTGGSACRAWRTVDGLTWYSAPVFGVPRVADEFAGHPSPFPTVAWRGYVLSEYDGDTLTVRFDAGFYGTFVRDVRVYGINAPELKTGTKRSRAWGAKALAFGQSICPVGTPVTLVTSMDANPADPSEKYSRVLAKITVYRPDGTTFDFGAAMLASDTHVVAYNPDPGHDPVPAARKASSKVATKARRR